jgi:hypothetical protein
LVRGKITIIINVLAWRKLDKALQLGKFVALSYIIEERCPQ